MQVHICSKRGFLRILHAKCLNLQKNYFFNDFEAFFRKKLQFECFLVVDLNILDGPGTKMQIQPEKFKK